MIDFNIIKQQNRLVTKDEKILIKPMGRYEYTTFPLDDLEGVILITLEEYLGLRSNYYRFNETLTGLELNERDDAT